MVGTDCGDVKRNACTYFGRVCCSGEPSSQLTDEMDRPLLPAPLSLPEDGGWRPQGALIYTPVHEGPGNSDCGNGLNMSHLF